MKKILRGLWRIINSPFRFIDWIVRSIYKIFAKIGKAFSGFFLEEPEDVPIADTLQKALEEPMGLFEHFNALRMHITRGALFLLIACMVTFAFIEPIMEWFAEPLTAIEGYEEGLDALQAIDVTEPVGVVMKMTLMVGFVVSLPYIVFEILMFIAPGLSRRARILGIIGLPLVLIFFVGGMMFAKYVILPNALPIMLDFMGIKAVPRPSSYISFLLTIMFWLGLAFELPLVSYFLSAMGLIKARWLSQYWRFAVVGMTVVAAAITPTVDPLNMILVLVPLLGLYFISILMAGLAQFRRRDRTEEE